MRGRRVPLPVKSSPCAAGHPSEEWCEYCEPKPTLHLSPTGEGYLVRYPPIPPCGPETASCEDVCDCEEDWTETTMRALILHAIESVPPWQGDEERVDVAVGVLLAAAHRLIVASGESHQEAVDELRKILDAVEAADLDGEECEERDERSN